MVGGEPGGLLIVEDIVSARWRGIRLYRGEPSRKIDDVTARSFLIPNRDAPGAAQAAGPGLENGQGQARRDAGIDRVPALRKYCRANVRGQLILRSYRTLSPPRRLFHEADVSAHVGRHAQFCVSLFGKQ
jgi:hypothetical protein